VSCQGIATYAAYPKVTGGFRSHWGAGLFGAVRSVIGNAARQGADAYRAIRAAQDGGSVIQPRCADTAGAVSIDNASLPHIFILVE
jgi:hypothetical protein